MYAHFVWNWLKISQTVMTAHARFEAKAPKTVSLFQGDDIRYQ
jgi:hypothetical protein